MSSQLIDGVVIPYPDGKKEKNTRLWRDATDLELEQAARIEELEKRPWVGLTDEEIDEIFELNSKILGGEEYDGDEVMYSRHFEDAVATIEAKLKEKNI